MKTKFMRRHRPRIRARSDARSRREDNVRMAKKPAPRQAARSTRSKPVPTPPVEKTSPTLLKQALNASGGVLRLAPTWVPRSFLTPGRRLKLHLADLYAYGANRGGIDERWFASTTPAANEGAAWDEGLSYVVHDRKKA